MSGADAIRAGVATAVTRVIAPPPPNKNIPGRKDTQNESRGDGDSETVWLIQECKI